MTAKMLGTDFITIEVSRLTPLELWAFTTDEPLVKAIEFDDNERVFLADLRDGRRFRLPLELFPELKGASDQYLHDVVAINMGAVLQWTGLDVHYSVVNLIESLREKDEPSD
jgi:Protein of unknown function (DUF2442)